jgi:hypothetical protein
LTTFSIIGDSSACGISAEKILVTYNYAVGSIVYNINKAKIGILNAVAIKKVRIINPMPPPVGNNKIPSIYITTGDRHTTILYQDTYNGLWNDYDLCSEQEATDFAIAYLEKRQAAILEEMIDCEM